MKEALFVEIMRKNTADIMIYQECEGIQNSYAAYVTEHDVVPKCIILTKYTDTTKIVDQNSLYLEGVITFPQKENPNNTRLYIDYGNKEYDNLNGASLTIDYS